MRHTFSIFILALFAIAGCEQPNQGMNRYEQLTDANFPYDPSIIDLEAPEQSTWNQPVPAQIEEPLAYVEPYIEEPASTSQIHVVQARDTLYGLARLYYNDHTKWKKIYEANRDQISDPNLIKAGMKLVIP